MRKGSFSMIISMILFAMPALGYQFVPADKQAYAEGIMQSQSVISLYATDYTVVGLNNDGLAIGIAIKDQDYDENLIKSLMYQGLDTCQKILRRYPELPYCTFVICNSTDFPIAFAGLFNKEDVTKEWPVPLGGYLL